MKTKLNTLLAALALLSILIFQASTLFAQPTAFTYNGRLIDNGSFANGSYDLRFSLFDNSTQVAGPITISAVEVINGLFIVTLDFDKAAFPGEDRFLEIAARTNGAATFTTLTPRQKITSVPYAITACNVTGTVPPAGLSGTYSSAVTFNNAGNSFSGSGAGLIGISRLDAPDGNPAPAVQVDNGGSVGIGTATPHTSTKLTVQGIGANSGLVTFRDSAGVNKWHLTRENGGLNFVESGVAANRLLLRDGGNVGIGVTTPTNRLHVGGGSTLGGDTIIAGQAQLLDTSDAQLSLESFNLTGRRRWTLQTTAATGNRVRDGSFQIVDSTSGDLRLLILTNGNVGIGQSNPQALLHVDGGIKVGPATAPTVVISKGDAAIGSEITLFNGSGAATMNLDAHFGTSAGGRIMLADGAGNQRITLQAQEASQAGGEIVLYRGTEAVIELDADRSDGARIVTQVLEITGGSDLSENFDVTALDGSLQPGMIVCIDPANPGQLKTSSKACDRTVAGVISGAGGVKPGMLMGQQGTKADGAHPVALTGRVYCLVDASHGPIQPGDLITTSDTPGHGMKASDPNRTHGAILGKAMSALETGKGLVLVLVSLQ